MTDGISDLLLEDRLRFPGDAGFDTLAVYSAAMVPGAPHPEAARAWLAFIGSDAAFKVLARYDFKRYQEKAQ